MAKKLTEQRLNTEVKRLKAKLVGQGLKPERLPSDAHFEIAAEAGAELVEDVSQRLRNRKVFRHMPSRATTVLATIGSMHYQDAEENWQEIDTQLVPSQEPGWDWEMSKSHWRLLAKESGWVAAEKQDVGIGWKLTHWGYLNKATKEYIVKGQADYSSPVVDGSGISWEIFPDVILKFWAAPDQLREDIELPQAKREAIISNNPYGDDGCIVYIYEVKWDKCPRIEDEEQGDKSPDENWESEARIFLKNAAGKVISALPRHYVKLAGPCPATGCPTMPIRRRFIKKDGKHYLLFGVPISQLAQMPEGTIIFDPTVEKEIGAAEDCGARHTGAREFETNAGCMGYSPGADFLHMHMFWLWTGVSISGTITAADIEIYCTGVVGDPLLKVYGVDQDNPAAPTSGAEFDADPLTDAAVDWDATWVGLEWETSPSLVSIFQELVDTHTISNDAVMVQVKNDGGAVERYACANNTFPDHAAKLSITYEPREPRYPAVIFQCPAIV